MNMVLFNKFEISKNLEGAVTRANFHSFILKSYMLQFQFLTFHIIVIIISFILT